MRAAHHLAILAAAVALVWIAPASRSTTLFGLVDTGELFASTDSGVSWEVHATLPVRDAVGLVAGSASTELFLATRSGVVYLSNDAGAGWSVVGAVSAADVTALATRADGALLLLTATGTVFLSDDGGATFTILATVTATNHVSLTRDEQDNLYALTATGEVAESTDGGTAWVPKGALAFPDAVEIVGFAADLFVLTRTGEIARSTDQGGTWITIGTLSQMPMAGLTTHPGESLLVAATYQGELATSPDGATWTWVGAINQLAVEALANDAPARTGVGDQGVPAARFRAGVARPNPAVAGGLVTVPFTLPFGDTVALDIIDARGRIAAQRAPRGFGAGNHALGVEWSSLPSGIYFVRLTTGGGAVALSRCAVVR